MITPDLTNRQPCCGAAGEHHWRDCPTQAERHKAAEAAAEAERVRFGHSLMVARCRCNICAIAEAGHL